MFTFSFCIPPLPSTEHFAGNLGLAINFLGIILLPIWMLTIGMFVFDIEIGQLPFWATSTATTT